MYSKYLIDYQRDSLRTWYGSIQTRGSRSRSGSRHSSIARQDSKTLVGAAAAAAASAGSRRTSQGSNLLGGGGIRSKGGTAAEESGTAGGGGVGDLDDDDDEEDDELGGLGTGNNSQLPSGGPGDKVCFQQTHNQGLCEVFLTVSRNIMRLARYA